MIFRTFIDRPATRLSWCLLAIALLSSSISHAADSTPPKTFRLVHLTVIGVDGKPVAHRDVYLRGWERRSLGLFSDNEVKARKAGWLFTTDGQGRITVPIGNFAGWKDDTGRPGWGGIYALLVDRSPNDAGGVSQRFWLGVPGETLEQMQGSYGSQWGELIPLPSEGLQLTMGLQPGFTFKGRIVDENDTNKGLPDLVVNTWNDLGIDTHTGFGGQVFLGTVTTDANGEFEITHEFRQRLYVSIKGLWMRSKINDKWVVQDEDDLPPPEDQYLNLDATVLLQPAFHYTGTVTNAIRQPVAGAEVTVGISHQPSAESWGDTHHFEHATTDAAGHYDLTASSPWGTFLCAETKELGRVDLGWPAYDSPPIPPGIYNLSFPESYPHVPPSPPAK